MERLPSQQWNYEIITADDGLNVSTGPDWKKSTTPIENYIESMGGTGWELCGIYPVGISLKLVFKRPRGWGV